MSRMLRRVVIASIFLSLHAFFFFVLYFFFIREPETCIDGIQNQDEQAVDCGGICAAVCVEEVVGRDLQVKETVFISGGENIYDVLAKVYNGNDDIGASSFRYVVELRDATGQIVSTRSGQNYILPQETKNIIALNLEGSGFPTTATVKITEVSWEKLSGYQEKPAISIHQKRYGPVTTGFGFSEVYGLLSNESSYDFRSIGINVIVRDASGKPLAMNTHEMRTVSAYESREFKLIWPTPFSGVVDRVDIEVDADVFHSDNFIRQYFPGGKY